MTSTLIGPPPLFRESAALYNTRSYVEEYEKYRDQYVNGFRPLSIDCWTLSPTQRSAKLRAKMGILSLEEMEMELAETYKTEYRTVPSISIAAKIVNMQTGEIVWLGQAETTDLTLVDGERRVIDEFIKSIFQWTIEEWPAGKNVICITTCR